MEPPYEEHFGNRASVLTCPLVGGITTFAISSIGKTRNYLLMCTEAESISSTVYMAVCLVEGVVQLAECHIMSVAT